MNICNSQIEDIDRIFELYEIATNFQNKKSMVTWPKFKRELVQKEISENRQWKLIIDQQIACVWATTDSDPQIWGAKNEAPSIYIHRISTNPNFRGRNLVKEIVNYFTAAAPNGISPPHSIQIPVPKHAFHSHSIQSLNSLYSMYRARL